MIIEMVQRSQVTISDGRHKGIVAERLYTMLWEKIDEIYTGEIHVFEKTYKAKYTTPLDYCQII